MVGGRQRVGCIVLGGAAVAIAAWIAFGYTLHHFLHDGAELDAIQFAGLYWRSGLALNLAPSYGAGSFFVLHASPIFWLPSLLSELVPVDPLIWFALWTGLFQASLTAGLFACLTLHPLFRTLPGLVVAAVLAVLFAYSGIAQDALSMPHPEVGIVGGILLFWGLHLRGRNGLALCAVLFALTNREDGGLHLTMTVLPVLALLLWHGRRRIGATLYRHRYLAGVAVLAVAYAALAFLLPRLLLDHADSLFMRHYVGHPPFAHLTETAIAERLDWWWRWRSYVWLPVVALLLWAALARRPFLAVGAVATLPWLALSFVAALPVTWTMDRHYGFPLLVALGWWPVGLALEGRLLAGWRCDGRAAAAGFGVLALGIVSLSPYGPVFHPGKLGWHLAPRLERLDPVRAFERELTTLLPKLGNVRTDPRVQGLALHDLTFLLWIKSQIWEPDQRRFRDLEFPETGIGAMLVWDSPSPVPMRQLTLEANGLYCHYAVAGTRVVVSTRLRHPALEAAPDRYRLLPDRVVPWLPSGFGCPLG